MAKLLKKAIFLGLMAICFYLIGFGYINSHEFIHKQIYTRYEVENGYSLNRLTLSGQTWVNLEQMYKCNDSCKLQNALNDIVGYYLVIILFSIFSLFILNIAYKRLK